MPKTHTAAGLLAHDPLDHYVSDVFVGPHNHRSEINLAVGFIRQGLELSQYSAEGFAASFNSELTRAVQHEATRNSAAKKIIVMFQKHGKDVAQVLGDKFRESVAGVGLGTIDSSSLLDTVIGSRHMRNGRHGATEDFSAPWKFAELMEKCGKSPHSFRAASSKIPGLSGWPRGTQLEKKATINKHDTIIFCAILKGLKGRKYCIFLDSHNVQPHWKGADHSHYVNGYTDGKAKNIQDEKTRAKERMEQLSDCDILDAINRYLPSEFPGASKLLQHAQLA